MDFRFTEEEDRFRQEVREFLAKELSQGGREVDAVIDEHGSENLALKRSLQKKMAQKGWLALTWPKKYGGSERTHMEQVILQEELGNSDAPGWDQFGSGMFGPTLLIYGTEEQKMEHLLPIARGEVLWCEGFSEPEAGSDLASLQLRAVEKDDCYVVNGQKVWTTGAHNADWIFFLARTDPDAVPKHRGISFLYADMKTQGIEVRPLINIANLHDFNEVYFDDVKVPKKNLVGEKNRGWYVSMALLDFERSGIRYVATARQLLNGVVRYVKETSRSGMPLAKDPLIRQKVAELATEVEIARMLAYRVAWMQSKAIVPNYEASITKVFGTELMQRVANAGLKIMGPYGQLEPGSKWAPLGGLMEREFLMNTGHLIAAGTSEVQRGIVATRGLGLPRA